MAYLLVDALTISGDVPKNYRLGDGNALDPQCHLGQGMEYRPVDFLHLRGGVAVITGGIRFASGLSLILGAVNVAAAVAGQAGGLIGQIGLSFGNPLPRPADPGVRRDNASRAPGGAAGAEHDVTLVGSFRW